MYFVFLVCFAYEEMLADKTPPHLVLDTTMAASASDTVKYFAATLALPTISASFGQEMDIRPWRNINDDQQNYLVQIMPPAELIPELIGEIVLNKNISNAAILFDSSFGDYAF